MFYDNVVSEKDFGLAYAADCYARPINFSVFETDQFRLNFLNLVWGQFDPPKEFLSKKQFEVVKNMFEDRYKDEFKFVWTTTNDYFVLAVITTKLWNKYVWKHRC